MPNGNKMYCSLKTNISLDYNCSKDSQNIFKIKENGKEEIEETVSVTDKEIEKTTVDIAETSNIEDYKTISITKKLELS